MAKINNVKGFSKLIFLFNEMKPIILVDPFPRTMELILQKDKLKYLKSNYKLIERNKIAVENFYEKNIF